MSIPLAATIAAVLHRFHRHRQAWPAAVVPAAAYPPPPAPAPARPEPYAPADFFPPRLAQAEAASTAAAAAALTMPRMFRSMQVQSRMYGWTVGRSLLGLVLLSYLLYLIVVLLLSSLLAALIVLPSRSPRLNSGIGDCIAVGRVVLRVVMPALFRTLPEKSHLCGNSSRTLITALAGASLTAS